MDLKTYLNHQGHGSMTVLGRRVGVPSQTIRDWSIGRRRVPDEWCPVLELQTEGDVTCEELRPELCWSRIPDQSWPCQGGRPVVDNARRLIPTESTGQPSTPVQTAHNPQEIAA